MKTLTKVLILWAVALGIGSVWMFDYSSRPGQQAAAPLDLPSLVKGKTSRPQLLVFLHPHCPCSRATLSELARLQTRKGGELDIHAFVYKPADKTPDWAMTDIWRKAGEIDGVNVSIISDDFLTDYGTLTSGQVMLYNSEQKLVFSGGITRGRGHEGDSAGRESIEQFLTIGTTTVGQTPVFGCIIRSPEQIALPANSIYSDQELLAPF